MQVFFFFDIRLQFMQPVSTTGACFSTTLCTEPAFGYFNSKWLCQHTSPCCALFTHVLLVKVSLNNSLSSKKFCVSTTLYIKHTFGYFLSIKKSATNKSGRFCVLLACKSRFIGIGLTYFFCGSVSFVSGRCLYTCLNIDIFLT